MHANDLFAQITTQLIADIEAGTDDWRMPWHCLADVGTPINADGRPYRGLNTFVLACSAATFGYQGIWSTYRSWQRHGAQVRKGERGTSVILWKQATAKPGEQADNDEPTGTGATSRRLIARAFTVFAAEQADGVDQVIARHGARLERDTPERITTADAYLSATGATIIEGGNRAFYSPTSDEIHIPTLDQFDLPAAFYGTASHELTHWTAAPQRVDRDLSGRFGSAAYASEELVAELGSAMWCAQMGLSAVTRTDHATYLASWLNVLKADARALVTVASKAQAAVDYLNTLTGYSTAAPDAIDSTDE